ncbi:MAG: LysR family transcriptional regulator [Burkholderiaceae bacterium]|nr:LysR family transcriptional regulator [Burkholderiaceae bacterium]
MHISDHVLRSFLVLADTRQFTVAAEQCHMTQSALSQMISKLEERVGVVLFNRETRSVTLTAEGLRLAETARRVTSELDQVMADMRDVATLQTGFVTLAVVPSLAVMWLPKVLGIYRALYPRVRLQLHDVSSVRCLELVRQGIVDFALNSQPGTPHEVDAELLFEEALYVVCPPGHPLTTETMVTPRLLQGVKFLHLQGTSNMLVRTGKSLKAARQVFQEAGIEDTGFDVNNLATLAGLVAAGLGVCLSPETSLPQFSLLPTVAVRISPKMMTRPIYFIQRKNRELSPAAKKMRELVFEHPHLGVATAKSASR